MTDQDRYRAPALEKGLDILELLATRADGLAQGDIARALDRSAGEIYRMLSVLVSRGYVVRNEVDDRYSLSLRLYSLSHRHPPVGRLIDLARPLMRQAAIEAQQSCHLGMESNGEIVVVASVPGPGNWTLSLREGAVIGLANTGTGRTLAAFRPQGELQNLIANHQPVQGEPKLNRKALNEALATIRKQGFDKAASDTTVGVTNLAFPVFDAEGRAIAALSCPYLERIDKHKAPSIKQVEAIFSKLAQTLTDHYGGKGA